MEHLEEQQQNTSYWNSVLIVGAIFAVVGFILQLVFGYMQINSEPTGSLFTLYSISGIFICLATCIAGMLAVWHYTKEVSPKLTLGQGAVIGLLTGVVMVVFSGILSQFWEFIDPAYNEKIMESMIANFEASSMDQSMKDQMIDQTVASMESSASFMRQMLIGIPIMGILNLLTGLIGVKLFAEKEEETF
jgi:glucan phosphoethanolaminetransferase (alkaline phosphatase superfamily)